MTFPRVNEAETWYVTALDGLRSLRAATRDAKFNEKFGLSESTDRRLFGMTEREWHVELKARQEEHEMFACLAVMAACEGAIRQDLDWRISGDKGQAHHARFTKIVDGGTQPNLRTILDNWAAAMGQKPFVAGAIKKLINFFENRNQLAHGTAKRKAFDFNVILNSLRDVEKKWKAHVPDFAGY